MLTVADLLNFEEANPRHGGYKEEAIRETFEVPPAQYYQALDRAIDTDEAARHNPMLVKRLRRIREQREADRSRRFGWCSIR